MMFNFLSSASRFAIPLLFMILVLGCGEATQETDSSSSETPQEVVEETPKTPEELLVGNWQMTLDPNSPDMEGLSEAEIQEIEKNMESLIFQFTEDGTVKTSLDGEEVPYTVEGDYILIEDDKVKFTVSDSELQLEDEAEEMVMTFIKTEKEIDQSLLKNQANRAKESEGKTYVGAMNRGQQAFYLENTTFATTIEDLALGLETETDHYQYSIASEETATFQYSKAKSEELKSMVGAVFVIETDTFATTEQIVCVGDEAGITDLPKPILEGNSATCAEGTTPAN